MVRAVKSQLQCKRGPIEYRSAGAAGGGGGVAQFNASLHVDTFTLGSCAEYLQHIYMSHYCPVGNFLLSCVMDVPNDLSQHKYRAHRVSTRV
eukprot:gene6157-9200_t